MREEQVTKSILRWLSENRWQIVCFDFPQSGTGVFLHPNGSTEKNKDTINPDIVAVKGTDGIFFENKDRFYRKDYEKQNKLIMDNPYTDDIQKLLLPYNIQHIYYGIGLPTAAHNKRAVAATGLVDFVIGVNMDYTISVLYAASNGIRNMLQ